MPFNKGQMRERRRAAVRAQIVKLNSLYQRFVVHREQWRHWWPTMEKDCAEAANGTEYRTDIYNQIMTGNEFARRHRGLIRDYKEDKGGPVSNG